MTELTDLKPKDRAEAIALFRSEIIGAVARRELKHGELCEALTELSKQRFVHPWEPSSRSYSVPTCLLYTSPSPRDLSTSRMPSSA